MCKTIFTTAALLAMFAIPAQAQQTYGYGQNQMHTDRLGGPLLFGGPQSSWHTDRLGGPMILGPTTENDNDSGNEENAD
jgi:hypothetical protein